MKHAHAFTIKTGNMPSMLADVLLIAMPVAQVGVQTGEGSYVIHPHYLYPAFLSTAKYRTSLPI